MSIDSDRSAEGLDSEENDVVFQERERRLRDFVSFRLFDQFSSSAPSMCSHSVDSTGDSCTSSDTSACSDFFDGKPRAFCEGGGLFDATTRFRQVFWVRRVKIALKIGLYSELSDDWDTTKVNWKELEELSKSPLDIARALKYVFTGNVDDLYGKDLLAR